MSDMTNQYSNDDWSLSKPTSNFATWGDAQDGVDGIFEIVAVTNPEVSQWPVTDPKTKEPVLLKDGDGNILLDENGEPKKKFNKQITIDFMVADLLDYEAPLDEKGRPVYGQEKDDFLGERVRSFYTYSLNDGRNGGQASGLYLLVKGVVGPDADAPGFELRKSMLLGKFVKGTIAVSAPKGEKNIRYPKVTNPRAARGSFTAAATKAHEARKLAKAAAAPIDVNDPPF
jgi:hypothetical protein